MLKHISIIYYLLYSVFRLFHAAFFRSVYVVGKKRPDWSKPNLVATLHPNSFLDAVIYADSVKPTMHFLARGDVFKKGFVEWLFVRQFNMIPIYRKHETADSSKKNQNIFRWVYKLLGEKANVMIFPEGHSVPEKRIRPLKKGTAWMAFGAMEEHGVELDVHIVPVALNYAHSHQRSQIMMIRYGNPIRVADYWELYQKDPYAAVGAVTKALYEELNKEMVTIDKKEADPLGLPALEIARHDAYTPEVGWLRKHESATFGAEKEMAEAVNTLYEQDKDQFEVLKGQAEEYTQLLKQHQLSDRALSPNQGLRTWEKVLMGVGLPIWLLSLPLIAWPNRIGKRIVEKRKLWGTQWYLSIWYGVEWALFTLTYLLLVILAFVMLGTTGGWATLVGLILVGILGARYHTMMGRVWQRMKFARLKKSKPEVAQTLIKLRNALRQLAN